MDQQKTEKDSSIQHSPLFLGEAAIGEACEDVQNETTTPKRSMLLIPCHSLDGALRLNRCFLLRVLKKVFSGLRSSFGPALRIRPFSIPKAWQQFSVSLHLNVRWLLQKETCFVAGEKNDMKNRPRTSLCCGIFERGDFNTNDAVVLLLLLETWKGCFLILFGVQARVGFFFTFKHSSWKSCSSSRKNQMIQIFDQILTNTNNHDLHQRMHFKPKRNGMKTWKDVRLSSKMKV